MFDTFGRSVVVSFVFSTPDLSAAKKCSEVEDFDSSGLTISLFNQVAACDAYQDLRGVSTRDRLLAKSTPEDGNVVRSLYDSKNIPLSN